METKKYWIEIKRATVAMKWKYFWIIKCCNGRVKAFSKTLYSKRSYCINDATAFASEIGIEIRSEV